MHTHYGHTNIRRAAFGAALLAVLLFPSCTAEGPESVSGGEGREFLLSPSVPSFTVGDGAPATKGFVEGPSLYDSEGGNRSLYLTAYLHAQNGNDGEYLTDETFSTSDGSTWRHDPPVYWPLGGRMDLMAYSSAAPFDEFDVAWGWKNCAERMRLSVGHDRTQDDILYGSAWGEGDSFSVTSLQMHHTQAWIQVVLKKDSALSDEVVVHSVELLDTYIGGDLTIENNYGHPEISWNFRRFEARDRAVDDLGGVYGSPLSSSESVLNMLVPQQEMKSIRIKYSQGGEEKIAVKELPHATWLAGKRYVYDISISKPFEINALKFSCPVEQTLIINTQMSNTDRPDLEYSYDGKNWDSAYLTDMPFGNGQDLYLRGNSGKLNESYGYTRGIRIQFEYNDSAHPVSCEGNIQHLLKYDEEYNQVKDFCFYALFQNQNCLIQAPELPATTLAPYCYSDMFSGCTSLTIAPELPATALESDCYSGMFRGCTSLTKAPELPATTLAPFCYSNMFSGCTSLTIAPKLPATELARRCYGMMFNECTSLTEAPELPATTLAVQCYLYMFINCSSLTKAPLLPAQNLVSECYKLMFTNCKNLSYVKAAFTTSPSTTYTERWLEGVSSSGTFVKNEAATWNISGTNGIPAGWTVETYNP